MRKDSIFGATERNLTHTKVSTFLTEIQTKDIIFTAFFIFVSLLLLQMADNSEVIEKFKFCFVFGLCFFFNIIFRSSGIYVFIFSSVIGLIIYRKKIKNLFTTILLILVAFAIYTGPISARLHAVKFDSVREMLSVPIMQLSRAATFDSQELSSKEKRKISVYIPAYYIYSNGTSEGISDGMKNTFNLSQFKKDPGAFLKLWFNVAEKEPLAYIDAFA